MRKTSVAALLIGVSLLLSGCWDIKSLQDVNYFTAIGIDYADGKYQIYIQQLDFASVAKSENGGKSSEPAIVWVGHAEGESISDASIEMYQTTQQTVFWGHLNSVVLSENVLKRNDLLGIFDSLIRYPEIRYTPWVYGTKREIEELFTTKPFFNLSPINSILYSPETNFSQRPIVRPMRLSRFIREIREPGKTTLLPSLSVTKHTWTRNLKADPKLEIDGVFALNNVQYRKWFSAEQLIGHRWLCIRETGMRIMLKDGDEPVAALRMARPHGKVRVRMENGEPVFDVKVNVAAMMLAMWKKKSEREYERMAGRLIADQIQETNRIGGNVDLLDLEHALYRKKFAEWNKLTSGGRVPYGPFRFGRIEVEVKVVQSGMYKFNRKMTPF